MQRPIIIVNCKTYPQATGSKAVRLAQQCEMAAREHGADIRIAVQATDISMVAQAAGIPVYAEHADPAPAGQHTGAITSLGIRKAGAAGAILNHSEHRMGTAEIIAAAALLRKQKLAVIICADSLRRLAELAAAVRPDLFCFEPPELIAGDVSVSMAQPDTVKRAVHLSPVPLLVGAGVRTHEDLQIALELGAAGVMLSSGIVLAPHRERALRKLLTAH